LFPFSHVQGKSEGSLSLTIAPPLFQISLQPGETWTSEIRVVNNNSYNVTLFAEPVSFKPMGETGRPVFISPTFGTGPTTKLNDTTLAAWITVPQSGFLIAREQTYKLPITIHIPEDATPGGHYAAVLIGNRPPEGLTEGGTVNVTSSVAALIFLTVSGDVKEKGRVREFSTKKTVYESPEATFTLRFENQGNVHLLPQGNIVIFNMFGKERGVIPVNHNKDYGNVLPESIREFSFTWKSDAGWWDIGRYKAEATIGFGSAMKQTALSSTYFYVLPIVPLLEIVGGLLGIIFFFGWAIKQYIRRAILIQSTDFLTENEKQIKTEDKKYSPEKVNKVDINTFVKPIQAGLLDLRSVRELKTRDNSIITTTDISVSQSRAPSKVLGMRGFIIKYKLFFVFVVILILVLLFVSMYFQDVMSVHRSFDVAEMKPDGSVVDIQTNNNID
jgi:hypothetical protein